MVTAISSYGEYLLSKITELEMLKDDIYQGKILFSKKITLLFFCKFDE